MLRKFIHTAMVMVMASTLCTAGDKGDNCSRLAQDTILIGDQVEWSIPITLKPGEKFFLEDISNPPAQGVEVIRGLEFDTLSFRRNLMEIKGSIILTSFDSGSVFLPPLIAMVEHADSSVDTLYLDGPVLEVKTIPIDTATYVIKDLKGQIKYPLTFKEVIPWVGLALLFAAAIYALVRFVRYRRQNRTFFGKPIVKDPPHIVALRSLDHIRKQKLWQNGNQKQFYTEVTDALRLYIAGRWGIATLERPSKEMLADLNKQKVDEKQFEVISELFSTSDLVKFAKYAASDAENEEVIPTAVRFVNTTYLADIESEQTDKEK